MSNALLPSARELEWEKVEAYSMQGERDGKSPVHVEELCCSGEVTQFPERMGEGCEGIGHDAAAMTGSAPASLDAIIKLQSGEDRVKRVGYDVIDDHDNYISDHKCIVATQQLGRTVFSIFSYNVEGLCRKTEDDQMFQSRMDLFSKKMPGLIKTGFIMCLQEVALQKPGSLKKAKDTLDKIKHVFSKKISDATYKSDDYTGAIFYDASVWSLLETLEIKREGSEKRSNAYRFSCSDGEIWVVNVHLKALLSTAVPKKLQFVWNPDDIHSKELSDILRKVEIHNVEFKAPVYMCGDYNNPGDKTDMIVRALQAPAPVETKRGNWFSWI